MDPELLWRFLLPGYAITIAVETPVLWFGLSPAHSRWRKFFSALWLTACTYPIVVLVLPILLDAQSNRWRYLIVAEIFAPLAECVLFWAAFHYQKATPGVRLRRDMLAVVIANLASFGFGEVLHAYRVFQ